MKERERGASFYWMQNSNSPFPPTKDIPFY